MKECPNCKKVFADDLFFCLYDGVPLTEGVSPVSSDAPTVADLDSRSVETQISPVRITSDEPRSSKMPYILIGGLSVLCLGLIAVLGTAPRP